MSWKALLLLLLLLQSSCKVYSPKQLQGRQPRKWWCAGAFAGSGGGVLSLHSQPPGAALGAARQVPQEPAAGVPAGLLPPCSQYGGRHSPQRKPGGRWGGVLCLLVPHGCCAHLGLQVSPVVTVVFCV